MSLAFLLKRVQMSMVKMVELELKMDVRELISAAIITASIRPRAPSMGTGPGNEAMQGQDRQGQEEPRQKAPVSKDVWRSDHALTCMVISVQSTGLVASHVATLGSVPQPAYKRVGR